jgi:hypothetical protein
MYSWVQKTTATAVANFSIHTTWRKKFWKAPEIYKFPNELQSALAVNMMGQEEEKGTN